MVTGFKGNTLVIQITGREIVLIGLSATGNIQSDFRTQRLLLHFFLPVHIPKRSGSGKQLAVRAHRLRIVGAIRVRSTTHQLAHQVFRGLCGCGLRSIFIRIQSILVAQCFPIELKVLIGTDTVVIADSPAGAAEAGIDADRGFRVGLSLLGGDDDDTVGPTRTVEGCRSGVFQNRQRGYIFRINGVDAAVERYAVHHIKRSARSIDRADAANTYFRIRTWLAAGRACLKSGHRSLERTRHVGYLHLGYFAPLDRGSRSRKAILLGSGVSHHHYLIQLFTVRNQFRINDRTSIDFLFGGFQPDEAKDQCSVRRYGKDIFSIDVGYRSVVSSFHQYRCSRQRFPFRHHNARYTDIAARSGI